MTSRDFDLWAEASLTHDAPLASVLPRPGTSDRSERFQRDLAAGQRITRMSPAERRANLNAAMDRAAHGYTCRRRES